MPSFNVPVSLLNQYAQHIKEDYRKWWGAKASEPHVQEMIAEFGIDFEPGSKYIKVVKTKNGVVESVHSFICNKDGKFPKGSILKSASFKAPATNFLRAYIDKPESWVGRVAWTGTH
jgi:hypothetical protein